jgi:hypothetical protein
MKSFLLTSSSIQRNLMRARHQAVAAAQCQRAFRFTQFDSRYFAISKLALLLTLCRRSKRALDG